MIKTKPLFGLQRLHTDSFKSCLQECEALTTISVGFSVCLHDFIQLGGSIQLKESSGQQGYVALQLDAVLQKAGLMYPLRKRFFQPRVTALIVMSKEGCFGEPYLIHSPSVSAPSLLVWSQMRGGFSTDYA